MLGSARRGLWARLKGSPILALIGAMTLITPLIAVTPHRDDRGILNHWVEEGVPFEIATALVLAAVLWRFCNTYDLRDAWAFARRGPVRFWLLLIAWAALTCALSPFKGFAVQGLVQLALAALIPSVVAYQVRRGAQLRAVLSVFYLAVILAALQGIVVLLQAEPGTGISATEAHGLFGVVLVLPLMLTLSTTTHGHWQRVLARIAMFLGAVALLVAHTWVCWPGVLISFLVLGLLLRRYGLMKTLVQGPELENPRPFRSLEQNWVDNRPAVQQRSQSADSARTRQRRSHRPHHQEGRHASNSGQGFTPRPLVRASGKKWGRLAYSGLHTITLLAAFVLFLYLSHTLPRAIQGVTRTSEAVTLWQGRLRQDFAAAMLSLNSQPHGSFHGITGSVAGWCRGAIITLQQYWRGPMQMIGHRPVVGWGIGCYSLFQQPFTHVGRAAVIVNGFGPLPEEQAHNLYIKMAAELGMPGLLLWVGMLGAAFAIGLRALRRPHTDSFRLRVIIGGLAVLAGQCVDAFADPSWQLGRVSVFGGLALGLMLAASGITEGLPTATVPTQPENGSWLMTTHRGRYLRFVFVCFVCAFLLALLVEAISQ